MSKGACDICGHLQWRVRQGGGMLRMRGGTTPVHRHQRWFTPPVRESPVRSTRAAPHSYREQCTCSPKDNAQRPEDTSCLHPPPLFTY